MSTEKPDGEFIELGGIDWGTVGDEELVIQFQMPPDSFRRMFREGDITLDIERGMQVGDVIIKEINFLVREESYVYLPDEGEELINIHLTQDHWNRVFAAGWEYLEMEDVTEIGGVNIRGFAFKVNHGGTSSASIGVIREK